MRLEYAIEAYNQCLNSHLLLARLIDNDFRVQHKRRKPEQGSKRAFLFIRGSLNKRTHMYLCSCLGYGDIDDDSKLLRSFQ